MELKACVTCQKSKAPLTCGLCQKSVCKSCAQFLSDEDFAFLPETPEAFSHSAYCTACFDENIANELASYNEMRELANEVIVYYKTQSKETRLFKRAKEILKVSECVDRDETVLRLAFLAAQAGYNVIVDVEISAEKVRMGGYQTSKWKGTAFAAKADMGKAPPPQRGSPN